MSTDWAAHCEEPLLPKEYLRRKAIPGMRAIAGPHHLGWKRCQLPQHHPAERAIIRVQPSHSQHHLTQDSPSQSHWALLPLCTWLCPLHLGCFPLRSKLEESPQFLLHLPALLPNLLEIWNGKNLFLLVCFSLILLARKCPDSFLIWHKFNAPLLKPSEQRIIH